MNDYKNTFWTYIYLLKVKVTKRKFLDTIKSHPDFPGFTAIADFLTELNVENITLEAPVEEIKNYPKPQLVQLGKNGEDFAIVTEANNGSVKYLLNNNEITETIDSFNKKWNNIVLLAEPNAASGEINYEQSKKKQLFLNLRLPFILLICLYIIGFQFTSLVSTESTQLFPFSALLITKAIGLIVSILLLYKTFFPPEGGLLDRICAKGKNVKCSGVLESKGAKLFGWLSWSEIGFFYFGGGFLALLFAGNDDTIINILAAFAVASAFYVFYSIFYQLIVVKQWCTLCLIVQLVFIVEAIILSGHLKSLANPIETEMFLKLAMYFTIPVLLWMVTKSTILRAAEIKGVKKKLLSFKRDTDVFSFKLSQQPEYSLPIGTALSINEYENAGHHLVLISNPYCAPCAYIYGKLGELKRHFENKLNLSVIYAVPNDKNDTRYQTAAYLISIYDEYGAQKANEISESWYKMPLKSMAKLKAVHPVKKMETGCQLLDKQIVWCNTNEVNYTPMLIFDGHLLSAEYDIEDLIYFIN